MFSSQFTVRNPAGDHLSADKRGFYNFQVAVVERALGNATRRQELGDYSARDIAARLRGCTDAPSLERIGKALLGEYYSEARASLESSLPYYLRQV